MSSPPSEAAPADPSHLVDVVIASGIHEPRLIEAFRLIPRSGFVPESVVDLAYLDRPLPIPHDQVTTQPSLIALMIDSLGLAPDDHVLEVGTGHGFQTALIAAVAGRVTSIERWLDLAEQARANLSRHGIGNVDVRVGDGSLGAADAAPFDAIIVSAAFRDVPSSLAEQLAEGGRLVQPIGPGGSEIVTLYRKDGGELRVVREVVPARFVRLIGDQAFPPPFTG